MYSFLIGILFLSFSNLGWGQDWNPKSIPRHPCLNSKGEIQRQTQSVGRCYVFSYNGYTSKFYTDKDLNNQKDFAGSILNNFNKFSYSNKFFLFSKWNTIRANWDNLTDSDFSFSDMKGFFANKATLSRSKFVSTNLKGCSLAYSKLINTDLRGANLMFCDLLFADFSFSDIRGTNFLETNLIGAKFKNVIYDQSTKFPLDFDRKKLK